MLLASIDRGIGRGNTLLRKLGPWFLGVLRATVPTTFSRLLRGSQFVTDLRISWIRYTNSNSTKPPAIVQVIGTLDQVVSKDILLHGIRASALDWPKQLAPLIAEAPDFMVLCPDYGYFTALRFAIPRLHRRPLRWFQDQYSDVLADNPSATFHFVGHSNGTYLLGQSMLTIKGMQFKRVFLGGCVLPAEFPWDDVDIGLKDRIEILINAFCHSDYENICIVIADCCTTLTRTWAAGRDQDLFH